MKLSKARKKRGLTQSQMAQKMGVSRCAVAQVEVGIRKSWPAFRRKAAEVLDMDEERLFSRN